MVQVLMIARTLGLLRLGNIALDGSKIKANASKHTALSYGQIKKLEVQLQDEVKKLMAMADAADQEKIPPGIDLSKEIARREDRLAAIATAKQAIETRAQKRFEQAQAVARETHHPDLLARFTEPPPLQGDATEVEQMRHLLRTMAGERFMRDANRRWSR